MTINFFGRERQKRLIKHELENAPFLVFNIAGFSGSGSTLFLDYLKQELTLPEKSKRWRLRTTTAIPLVVLIDGVTFFRISTKEREENTAELSSLSLFIFAHIREQVELDSVKVAASPEVRTEKDIQDYLSDVTQQRSIIILFNHFEKIIDSLKRQKVKEQVDELASLKVFHKEGLLFFFTSDHRYLDDILNIRKASALFPEMIVVGMTPLRDVQAKELIKDFLPNVLDEKVSNSICDFAHQLGGGHPALLRGVVEHLVTELSYREDMGGAWDAKRLTPAQREVLRLLPEDIQIKRYLQNIEARLSDEEVGTGVKQALVKIAQQQDSETVNLLSHVQIQDWQLRGVLSSQHIIPPRINGELIRYQVLDTLVRGKKGQPPFFDEFFEKGPNVFQSRKRSSRGGGRPQYEENVWAQQQIHEEQRDPKRVFEEWKLRRKKMNRSTVKNLWETFRKAVDV